ncbi:MAG: Lrp/AsnC family transcriptional regulator [Acidimicrobiales bacterium]|nr:Lrp/AsnC family transcriptional regulator [Acidimicrobiales bacterium]
MVDSPDVTLDATSRHIIELLQADGRMSYRAIAEAVGLSEAAARQRVQRLLAAGVMQIVAVTDPLEVGLHRQAMVGITVEGSIGEAADQLAALDEVAYVVIAAGSFDLLVEVVCADDASLLATLDERIRSLPTVRATETFMYLKLVKQTYAWGTRPDKPPA